MILSMFIEVDITSAMKNYTIGVIYRPPKSSLHIFLTHVNKILTQLPNERHSAYIMGDYNIDLADNIKSADFLNLLYASGFFPTITKPTRVGCTSATLLDNVITNDDCKLITGIFVTDLSDHYPLFLQTAIHKSRQRGPMYVRNYCKTNVQNFFSTIRDASWENVSSQTDANIAYSMFYNNFNAIYNQCFPEQCVTKSKRRRKRHLWITAGILVSIKRKDKLFKRHIKNPSGVNKTIYSQYRNKLNHVIKFSRKLYFNNKFDNARSNPKGTWDTINQLLHKGRKQSSYPSFSRMVTKRLTPTMTLLINLMTFSSIWGHHWQVKSTTNVNHRNL